MFLIPQKFYFPHTIHQHLSIIFPKLPHFIPCFFDGSKSNSRSSFTFTNANSFFMYPALLFRLYTFFSLAATVSSTFTIKSSSISINENILIIFTIKITLHEIIFHYIINQFPRILLRRLNFSHLGTSHIRLTYFLFLSFFSYFNSVSISHIFEDYPFLTQLRIQF